MHTQMYLLDGVHMFLYLRMYILKANKLIVDAYQILYWVSQEMGNYYIKVISSTFFRASRNLF